MSTWRSRCSGVALRSRMSERERRNLGEDERGGRELHGVCKGLSGKEQRKDTLCVANLFVKLDCII